MDASDRKRLSRTTIHDVSSAAGVSVTTVSRVLNKEPYVRAATREKVEAAIASLRFRPSAAARALAGQRAFQIALVYDNPSPYYLYNIQSGAREAALAHEHRVIFQECDTTSPGILAEISGLIDEAHLDGLILSPPVSDSPVVLAELRRRGLPFVRIAPGSDLDAAPYVHIDDSAAAEEMTDHLIGLGHRDIGFVIGHPDHVASARRLEGFRRALAKHGIAERSDRIRQGRFDFASGHAAGEALLGTDDRPTAVFASNDDMAAGILTVAHEFGLSVPRDVAVAGFDDSDLARLVWPPLTTVFQPTRALARAAALMLIEGVDAASELLAHRLVIRASTVPA